MKPLRIGVCLESLGLPLRQGLQEIERLGVTGVQVNAVGDLAPRMLSQTGRREVRHLLRPYNLELTALGCPLRHGLDVTEG
jgi:L-ribulose-5-phosphate 3-epimerase